jgi:hypothetical protein
MIFNLNDSNYIDKSHKQQNQTEILQKEKDVDNHVENKVQLCQKNEQDNHIFMEICCTNNLKETLNNQYDLNNFINFVKLKEIKQNSNKSMFLYEKHSLLLHDFLANNNIDFLSRLILFKQSFEIIKILKAVFKEKFRYFNMIHFFLDENFIFLPMSLEGNKNLNPNPNPNTNTNLSLNPNTNPNHFFTTTKTALNTNTFTASDNPSFNETPLLIPILKILYNGKLKNYKIIKKFYSLLKNLLINLKIIFYINL